ncbi:hypothetical protein BGZ51_001393 [Haplosporangium sp. Z 767]|nr:hypothetical protein BGZ51_001393 [Haplosporangium sp. Z 767]
MHQRSGFFSSLALSGLASFFISTTLLFAPSSTQADITCTQFGADTFRIGSTVKFEWNDTESTYIETFSLNLYCVQNNKLIQTITTLNQSSPSPVSWIVDSTLLALAPECPLNQYQGAFGWTSSDPETGETTPGSSRCKVMLLVGTGAQITNPGDNGDPGDPAFSPIEDDPTPDEIVITDKTRNVVIGVGSAVGALVLAGFIGFYVIRYGNKRAAEEQTQRKLREPIQSGPIFASLDRSNGGNNSSVSAGGRAARYNELSSITTASMTQGSPAMNAKTEMVEFGRPGSVATTQISGFTSPALGSRSPTPIAAAHAKMLSSPASPSFSTTGSERPTSLLTSSFVPTDESSRPSSLHKNPFEQQQYEQEIQQQQQQQQQNYGSYPY